jgi:hypothetical protein
MQNNEDIYNDFIEVSDFEDAKNAFISLGKIYSVYKNWFHNNNF